MSPKIIGTVEHPVQAEGTLHLYSQVVWHFPAGIAGTREALQALRQAIDVALETGAGAVDAFTSDGEGYTTNIVVVTPEQAERMTTPYTGEEAQDHRLNTLWYEDLLPRPVKQKALQESSVVQQGESQMSFAFEITSEDVANVLRNNWTRVGNARGMSWEALGEMLLNDLDTSVIEDVALAASTDLDEQTKAAYDEIERQLVEQGFLEAISQ